MLTADKDDPVLKDYCELLFDQALLTEGSPVRNPAKFARLVSDLSPPDTEFDGRCLDDFLYGRIRQRPAILIVGIKARA